MLQYIIMYYPVNSEKPVTPQFMEEMSSIVSATLGGAKPGFNRIAGLDIKVPYTDIALETPRTVDADPSMQLEAGGQALIYWPGGPRTIAGVIMSGFAFDADRGEGQESPTFDQDTMREVVKDASIGKIALERWKQRMQTAGMDRPDDLANADVTTGFLEFCTQQRLPFGFVTLTTMLTSLGRREYASLSFPGGVHPKPVLARMKQVMRVSTAAAN